MRSQGLLNKDNSILPKIKRLQENVKKIQKNNTDDKMPEFTITGQDPKQVNMLDKPNVKENLKAPEMGYDIVEDIKRAKANISLFEMCNVPQQKERLLKALEVPNKEFPTNNQPIEEIVEASVGGKARFKTPPFLLNFEILNHKVHNFLV